MYWHEKIPSKWRRRAPQWIKELYVRGMLSFRKLKVKAYFWLNDPDVEEWFESKNLFFILSIGRSGTKFLANLLSKAPRALVVHEPFIESIPHQEAFHDPDRAMRYIEGFRKREIYVRVRKFDVDTYGEVNSFLRRHCLALKKVFPRAKLLHLVRDGRDVVRSMYSRETMMAGAYDTRMIYPRSGAWRDKWSSMNRFERLCWYWMVENRYLRECIGRTVQFERILSSYEYFRENVLEPLGLKVSREVWKRAVDRPKNVTEVYRLPHWSKWSDEMKSAFERICGEEMEKCGYKLEW